MTRVLAARPNARELPSAVGAWSNDELVRWLLDNDMKMLVPAVIRNQICGESIIQLDTRIDTAGQLVSTQLRELVYYAAEEMTDLQLKSICLRLSKLQRRMDPTATTPSVSMLPAARPPPPSAADAPSALVGAAPPISPTGQRERCVSMSSKIESIEEKTTSKLLHIRNRPSGRGWSFEKQHAAWLAYQKAFVERTIAVHIIARQKKVRDVLAVIVLAISAITTVITTSTVSVGTRAPARVAVVRAPSNVSSTFASAASAAMSNVDVSSIWRDYSPVLLLLLSLGTTLVSGMNKLFEPDWREREEACRQRIRFLEELEEHYKQELALPVPERSAYDAFCAAERELRRGESQLPQLNVPPSMRMAVIRRVRQKDPEAWERAFTWLGQSLAWPSGENEDAMLMVFSHGGMRNHTLVDPGQETSDADLLNMWLMLGEMTSEEKSSIHPDTMQRTLDSKGETVKKIASVKRAKTSRRGLIAKKGGDSAAEAAYADVNASSMATSTSGRSPGVSFAMPRGESMSGNV